MDPTDEDRRKFPRLHREPGDQVDDPPPTEPPCDDDDDADDEVFTIGS